MRASAPAAPKRTRRADPIVRLFSSIRLGVTLLFAILIYASIGSALPQVRGAIEMTEMEVFRHWVFVTLVALFCVTLITATLTRIRWGLVNAGVLTVHTGLLLLAGGSAWYFGTKVEGDVLLRSPRVQVLSINGMQTRVIDALLAQKGEVWENFMPTLGGRVRIEVLETRGAGTQPVSEATVRVRVGQEEPRTLELSTAGKRRQVIGDRLAVRLLTFPAESTFYDDESPALYFRQVSGPRSSWRAAEMRGLPLHRERFLDEGYTLHDSAGRPVLSKRTKPQVVLAGMSVPTGWFEHWRLPIRLDTPGLPFDVEVTGYLPYVGEMRQAAAGGAQTDPAAQLTLAIPDTGQSMSAWLFAFDPAESLFPLQLPIEFRWVNSEQEIDELLRPQVGPHELYIEVKDPPVKQTVAISQGQTISVNGTPYTITIETLQRSWPLMSAGFERARSPVAIVRVNSDEKNYQRTVVERFPQLTQDIDEQGVRHREGPYDANLFLKYRSCPDGRLLIVAGPSGCRACLPKLGVFQPDGRMERTDLRVGVAEPVHLGGLHLDLTLGALHEKARKLSVPTVVPVELRRPGMGRQLSAVRLKFSGRGGLSGWSESRWCMFSQYQHIDPQPIRVRPSGQSETWELIYSRSQRDLGVELAPRRLSVNFFPGRRNVESWHSDFVVKAPGKSAPLEAAVFTNQTFAVGRWTLFQSGAAQDHWSYTILGVGNRRGIWPMLLGCVLITVGCLYAFYVKPVLIRRKRKRSVTEAAARGGGGASVGTAERKKPELLEVGS